MWRCRPRRNTEPQAPPETRNHARAGANLGDSGCRPLPAASGTGGGIDATTKFTLLVAGVEYYLIPSVRFSPNVEWVNYGTPAEPSIAKPKDDLVWRATFYWAW